MGSVATAERGRHRVGPVVVEAHADVDRARIEEHAGLGTLRRRLAAVREALREGVGDRRARPRRFLELAVERDAAAQAQRAFQDRVDDGLKLSRRRGDDAQDVGGRRLLLQCLGDLPMAFLEVGVALLQLTEQANIRDGDHRLVRERLQRAPGRG